MKKFILFSATLIVLGASAQTYVYHPFPDSNAHWNFYFDRYCQFGTEIEYYSYYISGDTSINNETYHKISTPFVNIEDLYSCIQIHYPGYKGAIRQDIPNKKVYFIPPLSSTESLLCDFNMEIGDTVPGFVASYSRWA